MFHHQQPRNNKSSEIYRSHDLVFSYLHLTFFNMMFTFKRQIVFFLILAATL